MVTMRPEWAETSTPLPHHPKFPIKEETWPRLLPGHGSHPSLLEEGAPQDSCSRPALVISIPTPNWPSLGISPWQRWPQHGRGTTPPWGHLLGKQLPLPVPLATGRLTLSPAAQSLLLGQHRPRRPPGSQDLTHAQARG